MTDAAVKHESDIDVDTIGRIPRPLSLFIIALAIAASLIAVFWISQQLSITGELRRSADRMSLYRSTLVSALEEHQHLPFILSWDPLVIDAALGADPSQLNARLDSFADEASIDAIYLMDRSGLTIAASNWDEPRTFVGNNYGFRPYFKQALSGQRGTFFAIGATTQEPGFFIAEPIHGPSGNIIGVIALKVDLTSLTRAWREGGETLLAVDQRGIVILASNPDWTYKTLLPLTAQARAEIEAERQFGSEPLTPLDFSGENEFRARVDGLRYIQTVRDVGHLGWKLHYLAPLNRVNAQAWLWVVVAAALLLMVSVGMLLARSRRIRSALFASQAERRGLQVINRKLADEIEERKAAERRLEKAQKELQQVSKLAALGQLSASVTHELGQPIAAMRNYLAAADLPGNTINGDARELVTHLNGITARMEHITRQLRFFAHREAENLVTFDLRDAVQSAITMMRADLDVRSIDLSVTTPQHPVQVHGDAFRIEQVLVNLIRNATDAVAQVSQPRISIDLGQDGDEAYIRVLDNGDGLSADAQTMAAEPFFSTKPSGSGMGLGLAISAAILKDHDGKIGFSNNADRGACFVMTLPLASLSQ